MRKLSKETDRLAVPAQETGVCWHLLEELTLALPFWRYHGLFEMSEYSFLLDSAKDPEKLGRYSFLGGDPYLIYKAKRQPSDVCGRDWSRASTVATPQITEAKSRSADIETTRLRDWAGHPLPHPEVERRSGDPFEDLKQVMAQHAVDFSAYVEYPLPLLSGAVGYFGYEAGYFCEALPDVGADDLALPDI